IESPNGKRLRHDCAYASIRPVPYCRRSGPGVARAVSGRSVHRSGGGLCAVVVVLRLPHDDRRGLLRAADVADPRGPSDVGRVIIVGFDGQDPQITDALMREGQLPNFAAIAQGGVYHRLRTTYPAVSPVA